MSVFEKFLLISLDRKRSFFHSDFYSNKDLFLTGAILMDLSLKNHINVKKKIVYIINPQPTGNETLDFYLNMIKTSEKPKKLSHWIRKFSPSTKKLGISLLHGSESSTRFIEEKSSSKFPIKRIKYHLPHPEEQDIIITSLKNLIKGLEEETEENVFLISLIRNSYFFKKLFDRKTRKRYKERINSLIEADEIGEAIRSAVKRAERAST